jgi:hypothetical protein
MKAIQVSLFFIALGLCCGLIAARSNCPAGQTSNVSTVILTSNQQNFSPSFDINLVKPWGLAYSEVDGHLWVANQGSSVATLYDLNGMPGCLCVCA